ncbi:SDR family oxidoreductase [Streptomyces sp. NBC_01320]|uniref:SDR family oxidoreductase n=1 Tax=Streptomyces sp. NBC_01320 TaxID=2903824 RepID=UPI002E12D29D|nr:SDR family oxidoreductase [Streptomyces sp. NBC_01320]
MGSTAHNRGVLVTGGCSGIGRAVVEAHCAAGDQVVVLDREPPTRALPPGADLVLGDVTSAEDNAAAVCALLTTAGRIDHFVGNAGIHDGGFAVADTTPQDLGRIMRRVLDVDVVGYALGARACLDQLVETRGCMTFTLSDASFMVAGNGAGLAYSTAKHAALGLVRHLAAELAPRVRVNAIAPGGVLTALRAGAADGSEQALFTDPDALLTAVRDLNPLRIVLSAEQLAPLYLFLASPEAAGMTGEVLRPDGGLSLRAGTR